MGDPELEIVQTAAKEAVCEKCGSEVRPGSVFCYNCGGQVAAQPESEIALGDRDSSRVETKLKLPGSEPPRLRSASSLSRHSGRLRRKPIEYTWESSDTGSNGLLIAATVLFVLFSLLIIVLMFYLK